MPQTRRRAGTTAIDTLGVVRVEGPRHALYLGIGNPLGSLVGALTLGGLQNGLTLMNVPSFWQYVASGAVVILAVYVDRLARPRR